MEQASVKEIIENVLAAMNIAATVEVGEEEDLGSIRYHIVSDHAHLLIGNRGAHLTALTHLIHKLVEKRHGADIKQTFIVDVDDYQKKRIADLKQRALTFADRARYFKIDVEMDPMPAYDRMIVHTILANVPDIKTESTGEGKSRRVVVRYTEITIS